MTSRISIVGLGKLGACMAAAFASRGFNVIGVDRNPRTVEQMNLSQAPVEEPALQEAITLHKSRLRATTDHREAIHNSNLTFVIVPTPSDRQGAFSLDEAAIAFQQIGRALADKKQYHVVVLTSTVLPGATRYGLLPILEDASGKQCGRDFGLCYSPAFIALGNVIHDFLNPDFTLIGEFDEHAGKQLEVCYLEAMENKPPSRRMSLENAELTKIALNSFITTKITFANMLADLCERIPGGDVDVVTNALGLDSRIGRKYLTGALGYGGPCFPRDNRALGFIATALGMDATIPESTDRANRAIPAQIIKRLGSILRKGMTVAILGVAYKPLSQVVEESQGIDLAKELSGVGVRVVVYDPLGEEGARRELKDYAVVLNSLTDCLAQADVLLITTPDPVFRALDIKDFINHRTTTVVDFWRILDKKIRDLPFVNYVPIGRSRNDLASDATLSDLWNGAGALRRV
jgi:UDPglucose 6-dehydrogenase